mmetsp:Transcript_360/g.657  ORF Transcript_360/g.657 Transcript_360/m.657 type:complete len:760 (-) Transcript_360:8-2287(-)
MASGGGATGIKQGSSNPSPSSSGRGPTPVANRGGNAAGSFANVPTGNGVARESVAKVGTASGAPGASTTATSANSSPLGKLRHERMVFILSTLVGEIVDVEARAGASYRGVFHTCSMQNADLSIVLKCAHRLKAPEGTLGESIEYHSTLIVEGRDVVSLRAKNIRLDGSLVVSRGTLEPETLQEQQENAEKFATDTQISAKKVGAFGRTLQKFEHFDDKVDPRKDTSPLNNRVGLQPLEGSAKGWNQFQENEKKFGIKTDYHEDLYTTKLDRNARDFTQKEKLAAQIAAEIEGKSSSNIHLMEERGQLSAKDYDEEALYGSVVTGQDASNFEKNAAAEKAARGKLSPGAKPKPVEDASPKVVSNVKPAPATAVASSAAPVAAPAVATTAPPSQAQPVIAAAANTAESTQKPTELVAPGASKAIPTTVEDGVKNLSVAEAEIPAAAPEKTSTTTAKPVASEKAPSSTEKPVTVPEPSATAVSPSVTAISQSSTSASSASSTKPKLNVNAKEFKFNPGAAEFKPFQPSGPATAGPPVHNMPSGPHLGAPMMGDTFVDDEGMQYIATGMQYPAGGFVPVMPDSYMQAGAVRAVPMVAFGRGNVIAIPTGPGGVAPAGYGGPVPPGTRMHGMPPQAMMPPYGARPMGVPQPGYPMMHTQNPGMPPGGGYPYMAGPQVVYQTQQFAPGPNDGGFAVHHAQRGGYTGGRGGRGGIRPDAKKPNPGGYVRTPEPPKMGGLEVPASLHPLQAEAPADATPSQQAASK